MTDQQSNGPEEANGPEGLPLAGPTDVPVFNCVIYVSKQERGYIARNGHWTDLSCTGPSERDAIRKLVSEFKQKAAEQHAAGNRLPFDDEPAELREGESVRLVPVHL